jgi:hypothetical protein
VLTQLCILNHTSPPPPTTISCTFRFLLLPHQPIPWPPTFLYYFSSFFFIHCPPNFLHSTSPSLFPNLLNLPFPPLNPHSTCPCFIINLISYGLVQVELSNLSFKLRHGHSNQVPLFSRFPLINKLTLVFVSRKTLFSSYEYFLGR